MKNIYADISTTSGFYKAGICKIFLAPREWLNAPVLPNFLNGTVTTPLTFIAGKNFIAFNAVPDSVDLEEKPKTGRSGDYYDVSLAATLNNITPLLLQQLETIKYSELVALVMDRNKRYKIIGNQDKGMHLTVGNKETASQGGTQLCSIDLSMQNEALSPFYIV
jgi:hypothetical protein